MALHVCINPKCINEFQDKHYGINVRVMNPCNEKGAIRKGTGLVCTVCETIYHNVSAGESKKEREIKK